MDVRQTLEQLYAEKKRIETVIASLEALLIDQDEIGPATAKRETRGRKSMSLEERRKVSERMKKYWAERRTGHKT